MARGMPEATFLKMREDFIKREGIVIQNNVNQNSSNTTVSSSNLGVADQMFSYGGVQ